MADSFYTVMHLHNTLHLIEAKAKRFKLTNKEIKQVDEAIKNLNELSYVEGA